MAMEVLIAIASRSMLGFALLLFAMQAIAREIGFRLGERQARRGDTPAEGVGVVVGGMLGLLAFVLALTLSFSSARFDERRAGTLSEANAIGTAWLRASAIGGPRGETIARLLEDYTRVRMEFVRADLSTPDLPGIHARSNAMQTEIWGHATALARERPDAVVAGLLASLNDTFDQATAERFAFSLTLPPALFWLLIGMSTLSMAALGYQLGLRRKAVRVLSLLLLGMWTATMTAIIDLGSARMGSIRTGTAAYEWTLQGFQGGVPIPPLR
jgi:hypothetical protein